MANEEQLNILRQGVDVWNAWRKEHPDSEIDLFGAELRKAHLKEAYLSKADLRRAHLSGANLNGANLEEADLYAANLSRADLSGANLSEADLNASNLSGANLNAAILYAAILYEVDLNGANLNGAFLYEANLSGANLSEANGANLNAADLSEADLSEANLNAADLSAADLSGTDLSGTTLIQTCLNNAILTGACLYGTALDDWKIVGVKCDFVYWDKKPDSGKNQQEQKEQWKQEHRIPKDRDFHPDEFEELYKQLPTPSDHFEQGASLADLIRQNESITLEFKSTLQWDVVQNKKNTELRNSCLKTVAAFLNSEGGALIIGVEDDGTVFGLQRDLSLVKGNNLDGFEQTLMNLIGEYLGTEIARFIRVHFEQLDGKDVCAINVNKAAKPVFMKGTRGKEFYMRLGNTTHALDVEKAYEYIQTNWK